MTLAPAKRSRGGTWLRSIPLPGDVYLVGTRSAAEDRGGRGVSARKRHVIHSARFRLSWLNLAGSATNEGSKPRHTASGFPAGRTPFRATKGFRLWHGLSLSRFKKLQGWFCPTEASQHY